MTTTADSPLQAAPGGGSALTCPLCGGPAATAFTTTDRNRELSTERFAYARCAACSSLFLENVPADLGHFYPASYYELPTAEQLAGLTFVEAHKIDLIRAQAEPGPLVEIGPGAGVFAYAAKQAGFDVTCIEMDERVSVHLREAVGVAAINSADPATALAGLPPQRVIAMWHVIEHLPNPWEVLDAAAAALEPGGILAVGTPNPGAAQFRLLKGRWAHVDAPRHLFLLPLGALTARARQSGLARVDMTTTDPSGRHWNRFGWEYAMRRRPAAGPAPRPLSAAALALTLALRPLEHRGLNGASYTALFRKETT